MTWHPSSEAGVRIPFKDGGVRPLNQRIETPLIARLRDHASRLARGEAVPRLILLVGGSGNGKTDAVEAYVEQLDKETGSSGKLYEAVRQQFTGSGTLPAWLVRVDAAGVGGNAAALATIGNLSILQDASASNAPDGDAAARLAEVLHDSVHDSGNWLLVACVNRGLLNRVLRKSSDDDVVDLTKAVARACSEVVESGSPPPCWPLQLRANHPLAGRVAVWPLDLETLLVSSGATSTVFDQVFDVATTTSSWEGAGCAGCAALELCPFKHNAAALRGGIARDSLRRLLRDFEIATGARWTFRQIFGVAAELLVGHPSVFGDTDPCAWVLDHAGGLSATPGAASDPSLLALLERLYPHVLFPFTQAERGVANAIAAAAREKRPLPLREDLVRLLELVSLAVPPSATHLQQRLTEALAPRFDPAARGTPSSDDAPADLVERVLEASDVSAETASSLAQELAELSAIERMFAERLASCEEQVNTMQRASTLPRDAIRVLRAIAGSTLARSVGARKGLYALRATIAAYEEGARKQAGLKRLAQQDFPLLVAPPDGRMRFDLLETLEQRTVSKERAFTLVSKADLQSRPIAPNTQSDSRPATELPSISLEGRNIPLTFDLYLALRDRTNKRVASSESAAIRAAIGQARVLIAGKLVRDVPKFESSHLWYDVGPEHEIVLDEGLEPTLQKRGGA